MLDFFDWIVAFFENIGQIVYNSIENLIHMFGVLLSIQWVPAVLGSYVPTFLATSVITVTAIGVIKLVLGWGNN